jgi:hypothetical protein
MCAVRRKAGRDRGRRGGTVNVFWDRCHLFSDPCGGRTRRWCKGISKRAGGAGEHKRADTRRHRFFKQRERAGDIDIHKALAAVRGHMRFVQRGSVQHGIGTAHALGHQGAVGDGAHDVGEL